MSMALMLLGSSSVAITNYSHPAFSIADGGVLNLREIGSQITVETFHDALRAGGVSRYLEKDFNLTLH